jgi:(R,R)-butanediol dehydrogenase/meso-butanediol dehydrogenase/diacetyl reductase
MKAAVLTEIGKPLEIREVPDPTPGPAEILLKVLSSGICGSDLHWSQIPPGLPLGTVMGHEFAGEVIEVGREVGERFRLGDRVCSVPFIGCGRCGPCLTGDVTLCKETAPTGLGTTLGAYAEYVRAGASEALRLPEAVSERQGALVEPLAVGLHAVKQAKLPPGARVLVIGAGPIGLASALWARFFGAAAVVVSEMTSARRELAGRFGATEVIDPSQEEVGPRFADLTGAPPDVVFECVGVPGLLQESIGLVRQRGLVVVVGVCMEPDRILPGVAVMKEVSLRFVVAYEKQDFDFTLSMLDRGRIASLEMVTDVVDLGRFSAAFEALKHPTTQCKVMLEP